MRTKTLLIVASIVAGVGCSSKSGTPSDGSTDHGSATMADLRSDPAAEPPSSDTPPDGGNDLPDARPDDIEASSDTPPEVPADGRPDGDKEESGADGDAAQTDGNGDAPSTISDFCDSVSLPIAFACSFYCSMLGANCNEDPYACEAACEVPTWECGAPGDQGVNTVFCRAGHAQAAATATDPTVECANAAAESPDCR